MKIIEVDEALYRYIASHTQHIGESASDILRRMLNFTANVDSDEQKTEQVGAVQSEAAKVAVNDINMAFNTFLSNGDILLQKKAVDRFILLLSELYSLDPQKFSQAAQSLQGRTRVYFAKDETTLLQHGKHTKPKPVTNTPYWVITNTNSERKRNMIVHIMQTMNFSDELIYKACDVI